MKVIIERTEEGRYCPMLLCDICGEKILADTKAEYLIPNDSGKEIIVGHTDCTMAHEKRELDSSWGNMSVGHLLMCLISNTGTDYAREVELGSWTAQL